ncbi:MAG: c-type cytochrome domain-containing protein, partial [Cyclobacteriaceae bacterium]
MIKTVKGIFSALLLTFLLGLNGCDSSEEGIALQERFPDKVSYNFHIRPILSDNCFACHGPDGNKREAGLRLDLEEEAFQALA